ncbi:ShlB/FhaC/HecB family hemolysin secretion/activation protein [Paracidovorax citrulli]
MRIATAAAALGIIVMTMSVAHAMAAEGVATENAATEEASAGRGQKKAWHVTLAANSGSGGGISNSELRDAGQLLLQLSLDWPLRLRDTLTLSGMASGNAHHGAGLAMATAAQYRLSLGHWHVRLGAQRSQWRRALSFGQERLDWRWLGTDMQAEVSRVLMRGPADTLTLRAGLFRRHAQGAINGFDLEVQRLRQAGWMAGMHHSHVGQGMATSIDASWLADMPERHGNGHEAGDAPGASRFPPVLRLRAALGAALPFSRDATGPDDGAGFTRPVRYDMALLVQRTLTHGPGAPSAYFSIGDRQTVRGFGGRYLLAAEHGWAVSHELTVPAWRDHMQWLAGADIGRVSGAAATALPGRTLAGAGVGWRGSWPTGRDAALHLQLSLSWPLRKPRVFSGQRRDLWFQLASTF